MLLMKSCLMPRLIDRKQFEALLKLVFLDEMEASFDLEKYYGFAAQAKLILDSFEDG